MIRPIDGTVTQHSLQLTWTGEPGVKPEAISHWLDRRRSEIEPFLQNNNRDVARLNEGMRNPVRATIERRRSNELDRRRLTPSLPFPVTRRKEATVPVTAQHKVRLKLQPVTDASRFQPEPELEQAVYEEILKDCVNQETVLERTPLVGWHEEQIRNLLLAQLNLNYTREVGGELFNGSGRAGILIRQADRNLFIGECKFYDGPKSVSDAVDQLLIWCGATRTPRCCCSFATEASRTSLTSR